MSGDECKALRTRLNLTQQEFADQLGVSRALILRGEKTSPSLLLTRAIVGLVSQEEIERLAALVKHQASQIQLLSNGVDGAKPLVEEIARLQKEVAELSRTIEVMMAVRKSGKTRH
ncbi:MAG: hypothetical protein INR62_02970 [Rhodospirillales bacterium]|nr:hypothetical protein [Acetobacter sp.]